MISFKEAVEQKSGCLVIIAGSGSDEPHIDEIVEECEKYEVPYEVRVGSAHKQPEKVMAIINEYNKMNSFIAMASIAGNTDALSGGLSYHFLGPVISCPPVHPNESCIENPPGSSNAYIARPRNLARCVAQMYSCINPIFRQKLQDEISKKVDSLENKDTELREKYRGRLENVN